MSLKVRIESLEKRVAELEGSVQVQPKEFNKSDFVESVKANMPSYVDISEGSSIDMLAKSITNSLEQALKTL